MHKNITQFEINLGAHLAPELTKRIENIINNKQVHLRQQGLSAELGRVPFAEIGGHRPQEWSQYRVHLQNTGTVAGQF